MEVFRQSVQSICPMFLVPSLHESKLQALYRFICGEDVFVNLPTGYDKSLIFQMVPLVHAWMHENLSTCWKKDPIIVIKSPLLTLMQDQVKKLTSLNLRAAFVGAEQEPAVLQGIKDEVHCVTEWGTSSHHRSAVITLEVINEMFGDIHIPDELYALVSQKEYLHLVSR